MPTASLTPSSVSRTVVSSMAVAVSTADTRPRKVGVGTGDSVVPSEVSWRNS